MAETTTSLPHVPAASVELGPGCDGPRWRVLLPAGWHYNTYGRYESEQTVDVMEPCSTVGPDPIEFTEVGIDDGVGPASNGWVRISADTLSWSEAVETDTVSTPYRTIHAVDRYSVDGRAALRVLYRDEIWRLLVAEWWVDAGEDTLRIQTVIPNGFEIDTDRLDALDSIVSSLVVLT